jgi:uncharacterized protein (TIGR03083 family)
VDVTRGIFDDLVGAYALDAVDAEEAAALDEFIAQDDVAAAEAERLRGAAAWLGAVGSSTPPPALRTRMLELASERVVGVPPAEAYTAETNRLDALLSTLTDADLDATTHNGLSVRDLVAHLDIIDDAFAREITDPSRPFLGPGDIQEITDAALPGLADLDWDQVLQHWQATRTTLLATAAGAAPDARAAGFPIDDVLVVRAFEAWTHHEDILRALDRPVTTPAAGVMRAMADVATKLLPFALAVRGLEHSGRSARVVLTGPGGGEWLVPLAPGERVGQSADVVVRASVVDFCRRFADRMDNLDYTVDGDAALAADLVLAAPAFAGL